MLTQAEAPKAPNTKSAKCHTKGFHQFAATLFFTLPYILPNLGGTGTAARRGPSPEPDDRPRARQPLPGLDDDRSNNQPANTTNDSINQSIELNQSFNIGRYQIKSRPPREAP